MKKRNIKKRILVILSLIVIAVLLIQNNGLGLFDKKTAYAVGDLNVIWGVPDGDPIFVVSNMLPGDVEQRSVDVVNGGTVPRDVGIRGVKTEEIASFSGILDFVISENSIDIYGGTSPTGPKTLQQFFNESSGPNGLFLSTVNNSDFTTYNFKATFPFGSGNEFQRAKVVFDLIIGIAIDIPKECEGIDLLQNPIIGTAKAETLVGTQGNDLIMGLEGSDIIHGNGGHDCILGGLGAENSIFGGDGNDVIFGNEGGDSIYGENGDDLIIGGPGADTLRGGNGNDHLIGNESADLLEGGSDNDLLEGNDSSDTLNGETGDDNLIGGAGIDSANGGLNIDTCDAETEINCEL